MRTKLTDQDKADIIRLVGQGKAIAVLAQDFKVSDQTIRNVVKKGLPKAKGGTLCGRKVKVHELPPAGAEGEPVVVPVPSSQEPRTISVRVSASDIAERVTTTVARAAFRKAAKDLSQAMLRDELTEALTEFFPEKAI
jgi:transposase-like protein